VSDLVTNTRRRSRDEPLPDTSDRPNGRALTVLLWALVVEHLYALVTPPYQLGIEHGFHLTFGLAYAWLARRLPAARRWHRVLLTVLLSIQFVGRFVVFAVFPDTRIRISLVPGAVITIVVVALLWRRQPAPNAVDPR
jgi:hypothetical protein